MKIETIEIAGLAGALTALRLPFGKEVRSEINIKTDPFIAIDNITKEKTNYFAWHGHINIHNKDLSCLLTKSLEVFIELLKSLDQSICCLHCLGDLKGEGFPPLV